MIHVKLPCREYYMDGVITWACKCDIFDEYYVGLEVKKNSWLKPSWRSHHRRGGDMRSESRGL